MEAEVCPRCRATTAVHGQLTNGEHFASYFVPDGSRVLRSKAGVGLPTDTFRACLSCGHLWSSLPPELLRIFIRTYGNELARQQLAALDEGPFRDLPDTPKGCEAERAIATIDILVLGGNDAAATRLYREATGSTWDQSIAALRRWRDLTRSEKLQVFGWAPKEKAPVDDWANPFP